MKFTAVNFTCPSCGAPLKFSPATGTLVCEFCRKETPISEADTPIEEHNLSKALQKLDQTPNRQIEKKVHCKKCGGEFTLTPYTFSTNCPYCGTPSITDFVKEITPQSLIPFRLSHKEAQRHFKQWVGSLWFAPTAFTKYLDGDNKLTGYYLPYWTYDSDTVTDYQGQRGDIYYVTVTKNIQDSQGRIRQVRTQEPRIRWTPVSGRVTLSFDDITVGASKTVTRTILQSLEPWDTSTLVPFDEKYLAGFEAEEYTVGLDNGFEYAKVKMNRMMPYAVTSAATSSKLPLPTPATSTPPTRTFCCPYGSPHSSGTIKPTAMRSMPKQAKSQVNAPTPWSRSFLPLPLCYS